MAEDDTTDEPIATTPTAPIATGPITTTSTGGDTATSTSHTPYPGELKAIEDALAAKKAAAQGGLDLADTQATGQARIADIQGDAAEQARRDAIDAQADALDWQDRIKAATAAHDQAYTTLAGTEYHDRFADQHGGKKVLSAIGMLLTGASGNQAANQALDAYINNTTQQDFERQKAQRNENLELLKQRGADINQLYTQWEKESALAATRRQLQHEAVAAKILEEGTRAGIPAAQIQATIAYQNQIAKAQDEKAQALSHFGATYAHTKELTPKVTTVEGKVQGAGKATPGADAAFNGDVDYLIQHPPSKAAKDAALRVILDKPTILQQGAGLLSGGNLPDFYEGLSEEDRTAAETIVRAAPRIAQSQMHSTRGVTDPKALHAAVESSIPEAGDDKANARKRTNLLRATGREPLPAGSPAAPAPKASPPSPPAQIANATGNANRNASAR